MTLVQAMRTDLPSVQVDDPLVTAAERLKEAGSLALPVVDGDGAIVGTLSVQDLAYRLGGATPAQGRVDALLRPDPVSCHPDTPLDEVGELMCGQRQPAVLVQAPQGPVLGIVDIFQILDALTPPQPSAGPEPEYVQRVRGEV